MEKGVPIRSLTRGIAVLQAVNSGEALSMMEIARASGVPYPTAFRIVQTLLVEGLIEQLPDNKTYRPTERVQTLANGYHGRAEMVRVARPYLVELTQTLQWPVSLMTRVGTTMVISDSTHAFTKLGFTKFIPGYTIPILECAAGLAFVAHMKEEERARLLITLRRRSRPTSRRVLSAVDQGLLDHVRCDGYATRDNEDVQTRHPGTTSSVAVPVFQNGRVTGALTMAYFSTTMPLSTAIERITPAFRNAATSISAGLDMR